jgi:hypothetical protein
MKLDPVKIPGFMAHLIPLAEKWGIGDDVARSNAVRAASGKELEILAHCMDQLDGEELERYFTGPEAQKDDVSDEYAAMTCLMMAMDLARVVLEKRRS